MLFKRILVQLFKLGKLPLALLGLLLKASLLLFGFLFFPVLLLLLSPLFTLLIPSALLRLVLLCALGPLHRHRLGLSDPLNVFNEGLLDLVVTHQSIERFLEFLLLGF